MRRADWYVVGMPLDSDRKVRCGEHLGDGLHGIDRGRLQPGLARREQDAVVDFDGHSAAGFQQLDLALGDQRLQGILDVVGDILHFLPLLALPVIRPLLVR